MNTKQKISLLVCVFSAVVFILTAVLFYTDKPTTLEQGIIENLFLRSHYGGKVTGRYMQTNYVGMIALGISVSSLVGYFSFKGKTDN